MAENLKDIRPPDPDGEILKAVKNPLSLGGGITILNGSLTPEGAVCKTAGIGIDSFEGPARVFDREQAAMDAVEDGTIKAGDVLMIHSTSEVRKISSRENESCLSQEISAISH
ncbi:MAG: dihydroxy-acid dehydratase, partial [Cyanobacteriota bacterium]